MTIDDGAPHVGGAAPRLTSEGDTPHHRRMINFREFVTFGPPGGSPTPHTGSDQTYV